MEKRKFEMWMLFSAAMVVVLAALFVAHLLDASMSTRHYLLGALGVTSLLSVVSLGVSLDNDRDELRRAAARYEMAKRMYDDGTIPVDTRRWDVAIDRALKEER